LCLFPFCRLFSKINAHRLRAGARSDLQDYRSPPSAASQGEHSSFALFAPFHGDPSPIPAKMKFNNVFSDAKVIFQTAYFLVF
jgi:hypothetical protein